MVLVDTSVWIEFFRTGSPLDLEAVVPFDEIVTCLPIVQEVLQGFRDERAFRIASQSMRQLPTVESPLGTPVFDDAIHLYRTSQRNGFTIRSSVDCLIAACALRHDLTVLHRDRDFDIMARVSPLSSRNIMS